MFPKALGGVRSIGDRLAVGNISCTLTPDAALSLSLSLNSTKEGHEHHSNKVGGVGGGSEGLIAGGGGGGGLWGGLSTPPPPRM